MRERAVLSASLPGRLGVSTVDCLKGLAARRGGGAMPRDVLEFDIRWEIIASNRRTAAFV
jgi:hypothetical protein